MDGNDRVRIWDDEANLLTNIVSAVTYLMEVDRLRLRSVLDRETGQGDQEAAAKTKRQLDGVREWLDNVYRQSQIAREQQRQASPMTREESGQAAPRTYNQTSEVLGSSKAQSKEQSARR